MKDVLLWLLASGGIGFGIVQHVLTRRQRRATEKSTDAVSRKTDAEASKLAIEGQVLLTDSANRQVEAAMNLVERISKHYDELSKRSDELSNHCELARIEIADLRTLAENARIKLEKAKQEHQIEVDDLTKDFEDLKEKLRVKEVHCIEMQVDFNRQKNEIDKLSIELNELRRIK